MSKRLFVLLCAFLTYSTIPGEVDASRKCNSQSRNRSFREAVDVGEPLFLTPLIESGKLDEARTKAAVQLKEMSGVSSYAGYLTVNKEYNSNTFFWFFPAARNPRTAPVVLWLEGGPGVSSIYGIFWEVGPFSVTQDIKLKPRKYNWHESHNMIYFDNPVGTGYSFTENNNGYATNETHVGRDVYTALIQFFKLFPELRNNDFFVIGESYAGKFVPAVSHAIMNYNTNAEMKINLKGLAVGNGLSDPEHQLMYGDYLYQFGLIDSNGLDKFHEYEKRGHDLIAQKNYAAARNIYSELLTGDGLPYPSLFKNLTGYDYLYNILYNKEPTNEPDWITQWTVKPEVRKAIHVGNNTFHIDSTVEQYMNDDILQSVAPLVVDLLQHYRVLIYNGNLDIIVAYPVVVNYLQNLKWPGAEKYRTAERKQWWVGNDLAGYVKIADNLSEVMVRNAGHLVPADQPKWTEDLITRFTHNQPLQTV